jgi:hypothetical protein
MNSERQNPCWSALGAFSLLLWLTPDAALADRTVNANEPVVISNDITNRTTEVRSAESDVAEDSEAEAPDAGDLVPDEPADDEPSPPAAPADDDDGVGGNHGHGNHGHGNNEDGVDSSNPGNGHGGPNGEEDASCSGSGECVDDESSAGGGSPSNGGGNGNSGGNGNGNSGGKKK